MKTKKKETIHPEIFQKRREHLFSTMQDGVMILPSARKSQNTDGLYHPFRPDMDFYYLTGIDKPDVVAVFTRDGAEHSYRLFLKPRDEKQETWSGEMLGLDRAEESFGADQAHPRNKLSKQLSELIEGHRRVYFPFGRYEYMDRRVRDALSTLRENIRTRKRCPERFHDVSELIHPMRRTKSPDEVNLHRRAIDLTWKGLMRAMKSCEPGRFEYELEASIEEEFRRRGGDGPAFQTIVGSGNNATILHYQENEDRLDNGELVLIDCGASYQYHCADVTRTIPVNGTFSDAQEAFYREVFKTQEKVIEHVEPGTTYQELQEVSVRSLTEGMVNLGLLTGPVEELVSSSNSEGTSNSTAEAPYKQYYMHKIGHWLGLETHDVGSYVNFGTNDPAGVELKPGMLLTIEPGLYVSGDAEDAPDELRGTGVRIEDDVLVTQEGCEVLSKEIPRFPKDLESLLGD